MADKKTPNSGNSDSSKSDSSKSASKSSAASAAKPSSVPNTASGAKKPTATLDLKATEVNKPSEAAKGPVKQADASSSKAKPSDPKKTTGTSASTSSPKTGTSSASSGSSAKTKASSETSKAPQSTKPATATSSKSSAPSQTASSAKSGGGFFSHLAASIVGGLLAIGGLLFGGERLGLTSSGTTSEAAKQAELRLASIEDQIKQIGQKSASGSSADSALKSALAKVGEIEASLQKLSADQKTANEKLEASASGQANIDETVKRLTAMEAQLKTIGEAATSSGNGRTVAELAQVTTKMSGIEKNLDTKIAELQSAIETRLADQEQNLSAKLEAGIGDTAALTDLKTGADKLATDIQSTRTDLDAIKSDLTALQQKLGNVQTETAENITSAVKPVTEQVATLSANVKDMAQREALREKKAQGVVLALEFENLKDAMDRGAPFADELARVKKLAGDSLDLSALEQLSGTKVPSRKQLIDGFDTLATKMVAASQPKPAKDTGFLDNLLTNAKSIVRVRKTGMVEGDTVEAIVARMEVALKDGKFSKAVSESKALPEDAAKIAAPYLKQIAARMEIENAMGKIQENLKSTVAPS